MLQEKRFYSWMQFFEGDREGNVGRSKTDSYDIGVYIGHIHSRQMMERCPQGILHRDFRAVAGRHTHFRKEKPKSLPALVAVRGRPWERLPIARTHP